MMPGQPTAPAIPVTVLTGFLGSGKTTILAHLLRDPALARTVVIINEFGAVGIDHDLVEAGEESFVQLETGCLCCTVRGDLEATIADLMQRRAEGVVPPFERIVIETSGLADPAPILNAVMSEGGRGAGIALGAVVTCVDAVTGLATLGSEPQSARQVAVADRLILTKTDLIEEDAGELKERLRALNPGREAIHAIKGKVAAHILEPSLAEPRATAAAEIEAWLAGEATQVGQDTSHHQDHAHDHGHHGNRHHGDGIYAVTIRRITPIPAAALTLFLQALADHCGKDLLRLKGIVAIAEVPQRPAVIHGVQHVFHEPQWLPRWPSDDRTTRLVLIGRRLSTLWIERLLDAIVAEVAEVARHD